MVDLELSLLNQFFDEWNHSHFDGVLARPHLKWNPRLRSAAGRFRPARLRLLSVETPIVEVATYLLTLENGTHHVRDTLGHELIHYWLWLRRRPYGHTAEFRKKMLEMGVSRYNAVPKRSLTAKTNAYECPNCREKFFTRRRYRRPVACLKCCKRFAGGKFHPQFQLVKVVTANLGELGRSE